MLNSNNGDPLTLPRVIWFYGLSGSGKTTLTTSLAAELTERHLPCLLLDGDDFRAGLSADLGFTHADRAENIRRAAQVAKLACHQGFLVLAAFITPTRALRALARQIIHPMPFAEVYVDCDYATASRRDTKGLYAQAAAGQLPNFSGRDSPFEPPAQPDLHLETSTQTPAECISQLVRFLETPITPQDQAAHHPPIVSKIVSFLLSIGLHVEYRSLHGPTFLPGLALENGRIIIDTTKLLHPGDILHEAGHLAITPAAERHLCGGNLAVGGGEEMGAICWSYAAALHLDLDPTIVFHPHGYKGDSESLLENFREGRFLALPLLQWMELTFDPEQAARRNVQPYPHMVQWLRH